MARQRQPCGTWSAYNMHFYYGETPCELCREAARERNQNRVRTAEHRRKETARKRRVKKQRQAIVNKWKLAQGECKDCGWQITPDRLPAIDCDHVDPALKLFNISQSPHHRSIRVLVAELQKCEARCKNCHALRTYREQHWNRRKDSQTDDESKPPWTQLEMWGDCNG